MSQIISIKEARKILGKDFEGLDDTKVEEIIDLLTLIAKEMLDKTASGELREFEGPQGRRNID